MLKLWIILSLIIIYISSGIIPSYSEEVAKKPSKSFYAEAIGRDFVVDAPWRVESIDTGFPLFVFIKDSNTKNFVLQNIKVYNYSNNTLLLQYDPEPDIPISEPTWSYFLTRNDLIHNKRQGSITPRDLGVTSGGTVLHLEIKVAINNDFDVTQRLQIFVSKTLLPRFENWYSGDTHYHSEFTLNPKDFGAPLEATDQARKAIGLDWVTATDHSPDYAHSPLIGDFQSALVFWASAKLKFGRYERIIQAEELTPDYDPYGGTGLHILYYGDTYIHFSDTGKRKLDDLKDNLNKIENVAGGFAYAAHPEDLEVPATGSIVKGIGLDIQPFNWEDRHYQTASNSNSFIGLQIWNTKILVTVQMVWSSEGGVSPLRCASQAAVR